MAQVQQPPSEWKIIAGSKEQEQVTGGFWLQIPDENVQLFAKLWQPPQETELTATLTFVHGLGEHILRYHHVFSRFAESGIRVFAFDQRGFGRTVLQNSLHVTGSKTSAMVLGDSQGWEATMNDIWRASRLESNVGVRQEGVPHFIMGHSMGGLLSLCFVIDYGRQLGGLAGCIASAPAVRPGFPVPWIKRTVGSLLAKVVGSMNISTELDVTGVSRDPQVVEDYDKDPYTHNMGSLRTCENLLSTNFKNFDNNLPLLMTWGTQDRLTSMEAGKEFFDEVQCKDKLFKTFDGCYHELHNEPEKDEIIQYYIDWILEHAKNWAETKKN